MILVEICLVICAAALFSILNRLCGICRLLEDVKKLMTNPGAAERDGRKRDPGEIPGKIRHNNGMKNFSTITVRNLTNSNSDYSGSYFRDEVEADMRELGCEPNGNGWIEWIFDHVFENRHVDAVQSLLRDDVVEMKIVTEQGVVEIAKS